jgi:hypothetical protein
MLMRPLADSKAILNHALNLQRFSLANYVRVANPWADESDRGFLSVLSDIAEAHVQGATRLGRLLVERHATVNAGTFPTWFTALNDLSVRHLAARVVEDLERIAHELRTCAKMLRDDPVAQDIAEKLLRDQQHHLQVLRDAINVGLENGTINRQTKKVSGSTPTVRDVYGDAINRWTNEGGARAEDDYAVRSPRPSTRYGQKSEREPSLSSVLRA